MALYRQKKISTESSNNNNERYFFLRNIHGRQPLRYKHGCIHKYAKMCRTWPIFCYGITKMEPKRAKHERKSVGESLCAFAKLNRTVNRGMLKLQLKLRMLGMGIAHGTWNTVHIFDNTLHIYWFAKTNFIKTNSRIDENFPYQCDDVWGTTWSTAAKALNSNSGSSDRKPSGSHSIRIHCISLLFWSLFLSHHSHFIFASVFSALRSV